MVLFREKDIGKYKADIATDRILDINPGIKVKAIRGDLRYSIGLGEFRNSDLVLGCLDSVNARWALNRKCFQAGCDWIDGGISDFHGMVTRYSPQSGACYECNFSSKTYERFNKRYSCPFGLVTDDLEQKVPTTAVTTSIIAGIQVQEALMLLHGISDGLIPGERIAIYLKPYNLLRDKLLVNKDCGAHYVFPKDNDTIVYDENLTINQVIVAGQKHLPDISAMELPFDFVVGFDCQNCNNYQRIFKPKEAVYQIDAKCPTCGQSRIPEVISSIEQNSRYSELSLSELKIPNREVVLLSGKNLSVYMQIGN